MRRRNDSAFMFRLSVPSLLFTRSDSTAGAYVCASTAVNASIGVDRILLALRNSTAGAFVDTSTACNAIVADYISHNSMNLIVSNVVLS